MSSIRKQIFLICQCLSLSCTSIILTCTCRVPAWRRNRRFGAHPRQPCQGHVKIPCTRPAMKGRQLLMLRRMYRRQSRANALSQASDSQSSPSTHSPLLVLAAAVGERLLLPVQSRGLQCPPQKCSGSAECAFYTFHVLAWPTLS